MASAWRGDIGEYPPNPEGLGNTLLMSGGEADGQGGYCSISKDEEGILHCYNVKNKLYCSWLLDIRRYLRTKTILKEFTILLVKGIDQYP